MLGPEGSIAIAEALIENNSIKQLDLRESYFI